MTNLPTPAKEMGKKYAATWIFLGEGILGAINFILLSQAGGKIYKLVGFGFLAVSFLGTGAFFSRLRQSDNSKKIKKVASLIISVLKSDQN